eukprot:CAMPEP_0113941612 /NCGR_PEP_ID=MMETSP1339-20121228/7497_1 /TAXON_ID=94617 /ORGANISM="Fibrocapsa japonica" /LENGTH=140 /DNA_ID=CAMNT_0000945805 /DNA_START=178 /DNA_END=597 /DNA_ORIENTATION=- /assembly_acc=CAM_ASM_000762
MVLLVATSVALTWAFLLSRRIKQLWKLRCAVNTGRVAQVAGLGHRLSYFNHMTHSHLIALVHTRQARPPKKLQDVALCASLHPVKVEGAGVSPVVLVRAPPPPSAPPPPGDHHHHHHHPGGMAWKESPPHPDSAGGGEVA